MLPRRTAPSTRAAAPAASAISAASASIPARTSAPTAKAEWSSPANPDFARTIRMLRDWGAEKKYHHVLEGYNYRMDGIQGAVLRVKLRYLEGWTEAAAPRPRATTRAACRSAPSPHPTSATTRATSITSTRSARRRGRRCKTGWISAGVQTGIHYPIRPPAAGLPRSWLRAGSFPHSERLRPPRAVAADVSGAHAGSSRIRRRRASCVSG